MAIINSRKVQSIQRPLNSPNPDRIIDPFTIPPLDDQYLDSDTKQDFERWKNQRFGDVPINELELFDDIDAQRYAHLIRNIELGHARVGAPRQLVGPDGNLIERTKRPDDFASAMQGDAISSMAPTKPYEDSPFWQTKIDQTCFEPTSTFGYEGEDGHVLEIARAIPNTMPFFDAQELIVFPTTKAVSISQLSKFELEALGALLQDRYRAMVAEGYENVWFGMHRGQDGGGTLEHIHFQIYGSKSPLTKHNNIWTNEDQLGLSHFEFQRLRGQLTISADTERNTEIFSPYTGGFPLGMGIAFTKRDQTCGFSDDPQTFIHLDDMDSQDLQNWLSALAQAVETIEGIPLKNRANGLAGYSINCVVPPKGSNNSPMTWNLNPAKLRSVPFEQCDALENPIDPFNARDILENSLARPSIVR